MKEVRMRSFDNPTSARAALRPSRLPAPVASRLARSLACPLVAVALCGAPRPLGAAPAPTADQARAEALFDEAVRLRDAGKLDEACPKFAESHHLDPSVGALFNLGGCNERQGKFAAAVRAFLVGSRLASKQGDREREAEGQRRASELGPKTSSLSVRVGRAPSGLVVKSDGEIVTPDELVSGLPVDPGQHVVTAEASGYAPFRTTVRVERPGQSLVVDVPALTPVSGGEAVAVTPSSGGPPVAGYVVGGLGIAALGVGSVFGVMALSNYSKAEEQCSSGRCPDRPKAVDTVDRANTQAWVANAGLGLGLVGVAVGSYLVFFSPSPKSSASARPAVGVTLAPGAAGLGLSGRF
jgi:hypothetical protein